MCNIINNSNSIRDLQVNKPALKPINELLKLSIEEKSRPSLKALSLKTPDELFRTNNFSSKPILANLSLGFSDSNKDVSIIEPGSSSVNTNAIKKYTGSTWLGKFASNGNRETAIIIPKGADYNKPFEVIYHYHGHGGKLDKILTDPTYGLHDKIYDTAKNKNVIIVIPQGPPTEKDFTWFNGKYNEDMEKFQKDTMDTIKNKLAPGVTISKVTMEGHSAGGRPLMNAAKEGKLHADKVDFLDASYGTWASETYKNYMKDNPNGKFNLVYIPNSQTQADAISLRGKPGVNLIQSKVDHSSVPKTFFGT